MAGEIPHLDKHPSPALGRTLFNTPPRHTLGVPSECSIHLSHSESQKQPHKITPSGSDLS